MSSWAATLRIARRDARRARGRSALVVAMIALPVLGVTAVDVVARTYELSPAQQAERRLGAADAAYVDSGFSTIEQTGDAYGGYTADEQPRERPYDVAGALPAGSRSLRDLSVDGRIAVGDATTRVQLRDLAYDDPIAAGLYRQTAGRAPAAPDEVVVTSALADRLGVTIGSRVTLDSEPSAREVVGLVADGDRRDALTVLVAPGSLEVRDEGNRPQLLVDTPAPLAWADVQEANALGVQVFTREPLPDAPPEPDYGGSGDTEVFTALALVVGMALLEVVLLAGPAFAVGAKSSSRQLALLAASGGEARDVRRTVLGGGLVLGVTGAVVGVVGGVALAAVGMPFVARIDAGVPGPFEVRPLEVGAIALIGVGTALLAAWLPAWTAARHDVVAALTGRRGALRSSRRVPALGLVLAVAGALIAFQGARSREVLVLLAGSVLAELGLVALTPSLVGAAGRLGPWLPVAPRLALRDAARNRSRSAPAVAAILAAVAGSVAVSTFVATQDARDEQAYTPSAAPGTAVVSVYGEGAAERLPELVPALERELPARAILVARTLGGPSDGMLDTGWVELSLPEDPVCTACELQFSGAVSGHLVGDAPLLRAASGVRDPALDAALAAGSVVAPAALVDRSGTVTFVVHPPDSEPGSQAGRGRAVELPAVALPESAHAVTVLPPAAAERLAVPVTTSGLLVDTSRMPTEQEQDRAYAALLALGLEGSLYVERGYTSDYGPGLLALAAGSALLVLGASAIATGLAAADGRADLATLAAVGATPGVRRRLAGAQSLVTAGLGTALGVVAGMVPAVGLIRALNEPAAGSGAADPWPLTIPWSSLAVTAVAVPLVAALAAVLLTRSRLPLVRRIA